MVKLNLKIFTWGSPNSLDPTRVLEQPKEVKDSFCRNQNVLLETL